LSSFCCESVDFLSSYQPISWLEFYHMQNLSCRYCSFLFEENLMPKFALNKKESSWSKLWSWRTNSANGHNYLGQGEIIFEVVTSAIQIWELKIT
jgi:hypothetical protein